MQRGRDDDRRHQYRDAAPREPRHELSAPYKAPRLDTYRGPAANARVTSDQRTSAPRSLDGSGNVTTDFGAGPLREGGGGRAKGLAALATVASQRVRATFGVRVQCLLDALPSACLRVSPSKAFAAFTLAHVLCKHALKAFEARRSSKYST